MIYNIDFRMYSYDGEAEFRNIYNPLLFVLGVNSRSQILNVMDEY